MKNYTRCRPITKGARAFPTRARIAYNGRRMVRPGRPRRLVTLMESLAPLLVPPVLRFLAWTWSVRVVNRRVLHEYIDARRPLIVATWHQMILPGVAFFRDRRAVIMVSRSKDGEMMARVNVRMGFRNVRGSSSKGATEALYALIDRVHKGAQAAIMVDGPRGPAHEPKIGCILATAKTGVPLIPVTCRAAPAIEARNWDRTLIPLPFARVVISLGEPFTVPPGAPVEAYEEHRLQVRRALLDAEEAADRLLKQG